MRALRSTGSFAQRGDVLGCNCRCLHDGSWPLRHRREKRIGRGEDDDDLEQRHPNNSAIQLRRATRQRTANWLCLDTLASSVDQPPPRAVLRRLRTCVTPPSPGREMERSGLLASGLQAASPGGISGGKARLRARARSDVAVRRIAIHTSEHPTSKRALRSDTV